jgi:hypothetical protein
VLIAAGVFTPAAAFAAPVCPALTGADSSYYAQAAIAGDNCNTLITIDSSNVVHVATPNVNPYDGVEDNYVGVVNNGTLDLTSLFLDGNGTDIFGFDGDGIASGFGASGNAQDPSGYGGPNAYFTGINGALTQGTVNFITAIAHGGGTGYFSLEEAPNASNPIGGTVGGQVPEPSTLAMMGTGLLGAMATLRRRFSR